MRFLRLAAKNLWSFGDPGVELRDFGNINILIGRNNCGKSNVLRALRAPRDQAVWIKQALFGGSPDFLRWDTNDHHRPLSRIAGVPTLELDFALSPADIREVQGQVVGGSIFDQASPIALEHLSAPMKLTFDSEWNPQVVRERMIARLDQHSQLCPPQWADRKDVQGAVIASRVTESITYLSGWRSLNHKEQYFEKDTGDVTVTQHGMLHRYANPDVHELELRTVFQRVQDFFRTLTGLDNAEVVPARSGQAVSVQTSGRILPLDNFGDGVQHLLLLAFAIARSESKVLLIEEPETHLHPRMQRHLFEFIKKDGRNQFFITTHSPVFLDRQLADRIYRVEYDGTRSSVCQCDTTPDLYRVLDLLDVRASDLLQANTVIWVEGPTDRLFIRRCLELIAPELKEGRDFQIVFYGGRVRSHFPIGETDLDLVNLLRLSRHVAFVSDSDRASADAPLDAAKKRLTQECQDNRGFAWITDGREIENYFPPSLFDRTLKRLLKNDFKPVKLGQWDRLSDVLEKVYGPGPTGHKWVTNYADNKARLMPELLIDLQPEDLNHLRLKDQVEALAEHIRRAQPKELCHTPKAQ